MYYVQGKNYGYERKVKGGSASISYGTGDIREISGEDFDKGIQESSNEFMRLRKEKETVACEKQLKDYNALISAGIPSDTARRLTKYYG